MLEWRQLLSTFLIAFAVVSAGLTVISNFSLARRGITPHSAVKRSTWYFVATVLFLAAGIVARDESLWPGAVAIVVPSIVLAGARILVSRLSFRRAARGGTLHRAKPFVQGMHDEAHRGGVRQGEEHKE